MDIVEAIAEMPWFQGLTRGQLESLAGIAVEQKYKRDEIIFSEGDEASGLYVVGDGRVKIFMLSPEGKEQILHIFGPGEPFGEVAVFIGRRFPAYAQAMEKCLALFFPRPALLEVLKQNPDVALSWLGVLSIRLRQFTNMIENLSLKEVPSRLAAYLLVLSEKAGGGDNLELDITKTQLASLLGTIPETLSRILTRMSKQDLIELDGRSVTIKDRDALIDLADANARLG